MGNASDAIVTADAVRYSRGERLVLDHVDLQARAGEVTAVVGAPGSGRTTLMQILGATARPDDGTVRLAGHDPVTDASSVRALVGVVPEEVSVWEYLSCTEVLDTLARGHRMPRQGRRERVAEVLELTGLTDAGETRTERLDLPGRRRLGLAAALLHDPPILLLDSPTPGLDPVSRHSLLQILRDQADAGRAVLVTGADVTEFADTADVVVPLAHGRTGPAQALSRTGDGTVPLPLPPPARPIVGPRPAAEESR